MFILEYCIVSSYTVIEWERRYYYANESDDSVEVCLLSGQTQGIARVSLCKSLYKLCMSYVYFTLFSTLDKHVCGMFCIAACCNFVPQYLSLSLKPILDW